jgi:hypothetical protein
VEFSNIEEAVLNKDAFKTFNAQSIKNTDANARKTLQRARDVIIMAVKSVGNIEKQSFALYSALCHPELCEQAKTAKFHLEESNEAQKALHLVNQLWGMLVLANTTATRQGCSKNDQQSFMEAVGSAVVTTPGSNKIGAHSNRKIRAITRMNRILFAPSGKKRKALMSQDGTGEQEEWSQTKKGRAGAK